MFYYSSLSDVFVSKLLETLLWFSLNILIFYFPYNVTCMLNFKGQGFEIKVIRHRSVYFVRFFFLGPLPASDSVVFCLVRVLFYFWGPIDYAITLTPTVLFLMCLKWVGSFFYLVQISDTFFPHTWYHTVWPKTGCHYVADKSYCAGVFPHAE